VIHVVFILAITFATLIGIGVACGVVRDYVNNKEDS